MADKHSHDDLAHAAIHAQRQNMSQEEIFQQSGCHPLMNPHGITYRECRDSDVNPESIGIIFGLDCTGSMRGVLELLATKYLCQFMKIVKQFVPYPQPLMAGIGDERGGDVAPCQLGQFECEAQLIDQWLTRLDINQNGFDNDGESYELIFYAAARKMAMDCWEKRDRKGYLFVTGDDKPFDFVSAREVLHVFGDKIANNIPMASIIKEASKTFHPFFMIPDHARRSYCEGPWRKYLGDNVICLEDAADTSAAAGAIIGLTEGRLADLDAVSAKLKSMQIEGAQVQRVIGAIAPYAASIGRGGKTRSTGRG